MRPQPGWYWDPSNPTDRLRYWDGFGWTQHTLALADVALSPSPITLPADVPSPSAGQDCRLSVTADDLCDETPGQEKR